MSFSALILSCIALAFSLNCNGYEPPTEKYPADAFGLPAHAKRTLFNQRVAILADTLVELQTRFVQENGFYFQGLLSWTHIPDLDSAGVVFDDTLHPHDQIQNWADFGLDLAKMQQAFNFANAVSPVLRCDVFGGDRPGYTFTLYVNVYGVGYRRTMTRTRPEGDFCFEHPRTITAWEGIAIEDIP